MSNFTFIPTKLDGVWIVESAVFKDNRGSFMELYRQDDFAEQGITHAFVQDNQSVSQKGVVRGLHFQINYPQAKLVSVLVGCVYDVVVDLRKDSPTLGQWIGVELNDENKRQIYLPPGMGHGYSTLSEKAVCMYKCSEHYRPGDEGGISWCDPALNIGWQLPEGTMPILSQKDRRWPGLEEYLVGMQRG